MKNQTIAKKMMAVTAAAVLGLSLTACGGGASGASSDASSAASAQETTSTASSGTENTDSGKETYKIAVVKQMDHASLDEIANAVTAQLDNIAAQNGITIEYEVYSGQGEQSVLKHIGDQAIADKVDAIIPIATLAAQVMTVCAE